MEPVLGFENKKEIMYDILKEKKIGISMLQKVEITKDYSADLLSSKDYKLEIEESRNNSKL